MSDHASLVSKIEAVPGECGRAGTERSGHRARVLIADDEESMRWFLRRALRRRGFEVDSAADGDAAIERFAAGRHDVLVVDLRMPGRNGLEVVDEVRRRDPEAIVVVMTAFGEVATAVEAMRLGAVDYLTKPFEVKNLIACIEQALAHRKMLPRGAELRRRIEGECGFAGLIGKSPAMRRVFAAIDAMRDTAPTVLLTGESGTGKEVVARALHAHSPRAEGPFVALHCAALPDALFENELFGHEPGAFTGARGRKRGLLARADWGTVFFDEVAEISWPAQMKLARFLQDREVRPLGGGESSKIDVRVIAATNRDLAELVKEGRFRSDLYWRLEVVPIHLPPLRERREDLPLLLAYYMEGYAAGKPAPVPELTPRALEALLAYDWPGNVRELQNVVQRLLVLHSECEKLDLGHLPPEIRGSKVGRRPRPAGRRSLQEAVADFEREYLTAALRRTEGNVSRAARSVGLSRAHLHRKLRALGIDADRFRSR